MGRLDQGDGVGFGSARRSVIIVRMVLCIVLILTQFAESLIVLLLFHDETPRLVALCCALTQS